ncbi:MAG: hypothetical protein CGW95_14995 [Phenylobacterium zucineum]|nr:MAG: hypothetical protein CGW95_14995 [Phenylobacterium zucineum]
MANEFYDHVGTPPTGSQLSSALIRAEFDKVEAGFDKLPNLSASANKLVAVNAAGNAMVSTNAPTITGGSIDGAVIGAGSPQNITGTSVTATVSATVPTVAVDTNTTAAASTAFVLGQASATSPAMDSVATVGTSTRFARADHAHPTDTSRAPLASPTFTGVPAAPTAAVDTSTTQLATTAFVVAQASSTSPLVDGTATVGVSTRFARADHVHPTDTSRAPVNNPAFTGTVTLPGDPASALQAATKQYVDAVAVGIDTHASCACASTANLGLSGLAAIDGYTPVANDRILVKDQTTTSQNGIYLAAAGAWTRALDADATGEIKQGSYVFVNNGTVNAKTGWTQQTSGTITIGTTPILWAQFSASNSYVAGTGLTLTGNSFALTTPVAVGNGGTGSTTATGTGSVVLASSPVLTTPNLGTPSALVLTNATGLPWAVPA